MKTAPSTLLKYCWEVNILFTKLVGTLEYMHAPSEGIFVRRRERLESHAYLTSATSSTIETETCGSNTLTRHADCAFPWIHLYFHTLSSGFWCLGLSRRWLRSQSKHAPSVGWDVDSSLVLFVDGSSICPIAPETLK